MLLTVVVAMLPILSPSTKTASSSSPRAAGLAATRAAVEIRRRPGVEYEVWRLRVMIRL